MSCRIFIHETTHDHPLHQHSTTTIAAFIIEGLLGDYVDMYLLITLNIVNGGIAFYEASNAAVRW